MNIKNHTNEKLEDISKVIENPKNPNKHSDNQINMLSKIIEFQGWRIPIVVSNRSGFIVRGHGRLMSARKLGLEKVPVSFQDYESEAQEYADLVADNRIAELAEMDRSELKDIIEQLDTGEIDLDVTGFDQESLDDLMSEFFEPEGGLTDDDEIPEEVESRCKLGDLWQLGEHRLMCGDSTNKEDVDKLMDSVLADMVFTDPPYGIKFKSNFRKDKNKFLELKNDDRFLDFVPRLYENLKDDTPWIIWTSPQVYNVWRDIFKVYYKSTIIWSKGGGGMGDLKGDYSQDYEMALFCTKGKPEFIGGRPMALWDIKKDSPSSYVHPTQKPVSLSEYGMSHFLAKGAIVLDLFGGSGSTIIACEKTKRKARLMELDPHYCDVIIQRWEDFTGKKAEKIN